MCKRANKASLALRPYFLPAQIALLRPYSRSKHQFSPSFHAGAVCSLLPNVVLYLEYLYFALPHGFSFRAIRIFVRQYRNFYPPQA